MIIAARSCYVLFAVTTPTPHTTSDLLAEILANQRRILRPALVTIGYLMDRCDVECSKTITRRLKKYGIPFRDLHGDIWKEGPKRISLMEWENKAKMQTQMIKRDLHR